MAWQLLIGRAGLLKRSSFHGFRVDGLPTSEGPSTKPTLPSLQPKPSHLLLAPQACQKRANKHELLAPPHPKQLNKQIRHTTPCTSLRSIASEPDSAVTSDKDLPLDLTVVMKFGGSSIATADRMKEVARLVLSFDQERPVLVLSAMGKTTNKLIALGEKALTCGPQACRDLDELREIRELHLGTVAELGIECPEEVSLLLEELEQLITGIAIMREVTAKTSDYLVSFGERMSTRIFAAYLRSLGVESEQFDAFKIGLLTTDEFGNADVLDAAFPTMRSCLYEVLGNQRAIPVITGFLGKGVKTGAITTLGRGGSDLTATVVGRALGLREVQVWKDVDGVLTSDPRICPRARPIPELTFEEASELAYFGAQVLHPQSMRPARESNLPVRVLNSYNPSAPGTLITSARDLSKALLTCIVLKSHVTMLDIASTRMLGQYGFLARVFSIFEDLGISVDVVATSEVSVSLTLDPAKLWSRALIQQELDNMIEKLSKVAHVRLLQQRAIVSLIGNVEKSSVILEKVFGVLREKGTNVQMISQGASKVNISFVVDDDEAQDIVNCLHREFFE